MIFFTGMDLFFPEITIKAAELLHDDVTLLPQTLDDFWGEQFFFDAARLTWRGAQELDHCHMSQV